MRQATIQALYIAATGTTPRTVTLASATSAPSDFTGTVACNRHYSTGAIEGPLLYCTVVLSIQVYIYASYMTIASNIAHTKRPRLMGLEMLCF